MTQADHPCSDADQDGDGDDLSPNPLALASLVLGMVWVYWVGSVLAIVLGGVALRQIRARGQPGAGLAIVGIVLGCAGILVLVGALVLHVPIFSVS